VFAGLDFRQEARFLNKAPRRRHLSAPSSIVSAGMR
jgi:hypothetical protein